MGLRLTAEEEAARREYLRAKYFIDQVKKSRTLTFQQKSTLMGQARHGDLEGAKKGYRALVKVNPDEEEVV